MDRILVVVAACAVFGTVFAADGDQLKLVQAVWRHGDRSQTGTFKNDPYKASDWPQGWGQLSPKGMTEHLYLGKRLAEYYVTNLTFIDKSYKAKEVYVRSTDVNRTLISAMSNFIGFYGNGAGTPGTDYPNDPLWPTNYIPIPVHTVKDDTDYLGNPDRYCPRMDAVTNLWPQTKEYQANNEKYKDLLATLTQLCGEPITLDNIWLVYDALFIEKSSGKTDKIDKRLLDLFPNITEVDDLNDDWFDGIGLSPVGNVDFSVEVPRIRGGPLLWALINHMQGKANCITDPHNKKTEHYCRWMEPLKYYVYSAHDITVSALFSAFGFKESNWNETGFPHYSSCVTVELWQKADKSFYVKVLYWPLNEADEKKRTSEDLTTQVSGCEKGCTLDEFTTRSQKYKMDTSPEEYCAKVDDIPGAGTNGQSTAPPSDTTTKSTSLSVAQMFPLVLGKTTILNG
ncbi:esophageal gland cell secretory protein 21 [Aphelenchoides avenae]|nr:esophageal gland cell secretory protein 21 [Aphelenchus avenae]